jgi:hypothetical protein
VITVNGDSIRCLLSAGGTEYTDSATAVVEKIKSDRIKEFYDNEQRRLCGAVYINDKKSTIYYLAYAEKGTINLYYYYTDGSRYPGWPTYVSPHVYNGTHYGRGAFGLGVTGRAQIIWYVGKGSDNHVQDLNGPVSFSTKSRKEKKEDFALLLKDNPEVYNKFLTPEYYNLDHIQEIVHLYNTGERYDGTSDGAPLIPDRSYIITQKNDTVFCRIRNDYFTGKYMFKLAKQDNFNVIDSANAREFFYARDTSHFALVNEPGVPNKVFLKQLEKGKVNFYQKTQLSNDLVKKELQSSLYISKGDGLLILISTRANSARKFEIKSAQLNVFFNTIADNKDLLSSCKKALDASDMTKDEVIRFFIQNYNSLYLADSNTGR